MSAVNSLRERFGRVSPQKGLQDYSPSLMKYRMERIWLTPIYKLLLRTGLPLMIVVAVAGNHLFKQETHAKLVQSIVNARTMIEDRPEFSVKLMEVKGASAVVSRQVRESVSIDFPASSMRLDLVALKARIERVDAVKRADVFLRNGTLEIQIDERKPALVWRGKSHLELVDTSGEIAGVLINREGYHDLPLIVGAGAQNYAEEALAILAAAKPIMDRVRGLRRMGERRWDLVLDREQLIKLPVQDPVRALERVIALQAARDVLARDVLVIDMRDGRRPVLRLPVPTLNEQFGLRSVADKRSEL